ncbi:MAG: NAD-dependent epimerase [Cenarchaeum symbiont of Oopsacas minuta]|nr:NAD-dependent epimerase [Cenarchaeum symbiont of Oopsacas minuta]
MKFAVIGGAGFIGNNIVRLLLNNDHTVHVIDNLHTGKLENLTNIKNDIVFKKIDIRDFDKLNNALENIDGIFHQAALTSVPESYEKPKEYYNVNVIGTENIFKIAKKNNQKVVYASSSSVYGNAETIPIKENSPRNPINPYGQTKLEKEFLAEKFSNKGVEIIGLRYFNVFGLGQTNSYAGVITKFMNRLSDKLLPIINGNGKQVRDFIYVNDVANANIAAMNCSIKSGFFNIGTGKTVSINDLAKVMIKLYGLEFKPKYVDALKGDVDKSQADTKLAEKSLNWKYKTDLQNGLSYIIKPTVYT